MIQVPDLSTENGRFRAYCIAQQLSFMANKTASDAIAAMRGSSPEAQALLTQYIEQSRQNRAAYQEVADAVLESARGDGDEWVRGNEVCPPPEPTYRANQSLNGISPMGVIPLAAIPISVIIKGAVAILLLRSVGWALSDATQGAVIEHEQTKQKAIAAYQRCKNTGGQNCTTVLKAIGKPPGANWALAIGAAAAAAALYIYTRG